MNEPFEKKVRAAAVAGWRVILVAVGFLTLLWLLYLAVMSARPPWLLTLWGPGVDWPFVQSVWFWLDPAPGEQGQEAVQGVVRVTDGENGCRHGLLPALIVPAAPVE